MDHRSIHSIDDIGSIFYLLVTRSAYGSSSYKFNLFSSEHNHKATPNVQIQVCFFVFYITKNKNNRVLRIIFNDLGH